MSLLEVALACWILNCAAVGVLAHFLGWSAAFLIVVGAWCGIAALGLVVSLVDTARGEATARQRGHRILQDGAALLRMLCGVLAFPIAYAVIRIRVRRHESKCDAAMAAARQAGR